MIDSDGLEWIEIIRAVVGIKFNGICKRRNEDV